MENEDAKNPWPGLSLPYKISPLPRAGLTSLSAETRQIVDRHQEVESRDSRKMAWVTVVLVATLALALIFLSAVHG